MSPTNNNGPPRGRAIGPVWVERDLIKSKAFWALTGSAPQVLLAFLAKRQLERVGRGRNRRYALVNNGQIVFTYIEAKRKYGLWDKSFRASLEQLMEKGFLAVEEPGGGLMGHPSKYRLTDGWRTWTPPASQQ